MDNESLSSPSTSTSTSTTFFPSLKTLILSDMSNLKGWWNSDERVTTTASSSSSSIAAEQQQQQLLLSLPSFPCLSKLDIWSCPKLTSMPLLSSCVEVVELSGVSGMLLFQQLMATATPVVSSTMVTTTAAAAVATPSSSSSSSASLLVPLSQLMSLSINLMDDDWPEDHMDVLNSLPDEGLRNLTSLWFLQIHHCNKLRSLSGGLRHLTALQTLKILSCEELDLLDDDDGMQFQGLSSLTSLSIADIPKLASLPAGLQHVTTLQSLTIVNIPNLMTLPEWMGKLTSLQELHIFYCPLLIGRCQKETGEDWPIIAHIPYVDVS